VAERSEWSGGAQRRLVIYLPHRLSIWRLPQRTVEEIRRRFRRRLHIDTPLTETSFLRVLPDAEILFAWGLARRHVGKARSLRWLHSPLAGVDRVLNPELAPTAIRVTSSRGINSVAVAEHTLALILSMTRGLAAAVRAQAARQWTQAELFGRKPPLDELQGKVLWCGDRARSRTTSTGYSRAAGPTP
jgi:phosphoglycerate dehydrogenase-like enzyme